ncbi:EKC/KEOPS complex subunit BUD32 [Cryptococcus tetragattii IND107]|uniref:non-specific serine/threonine protein kinase n=1 Tax=Cryptococcus tetragattii IND107 TaxID=1296105 RepID=A0ABR3BQQ5_9TREE
MAASTSLLSQGTLIKQGAEAKVYALPSLFPEPTIYNPASSSSSSPSPPTPVVLKHRFTKTYRHPTLDASLTSQRLTFEARALARAAKAGVTVPKVVWVDEKAGVIGMERIEGWSVREVLGGGAEGEVEIIAKQEIEGDVENKIEATPIREEPEETENEGLKALKNLGVTEEHLMRSIGAALARLHKTMIIHGDLTTSNMMVRLTPGGPGPYEIVLIDFGLSFQAQFPENYAVDLYVLERAFASTHPRSEKLYAGVLETYAEGLGEKKWKPIQIKLKDVRRRGRKRDMTG